MSLSPHLPRSAALLGYAGLIPFVAAAFLVVADWRADWALTAFTGYAAVILAFLGGIQWGLALGGPGGDVDPVERFAVGVLPSLVGWLALLLPAAAGIGLLGAGFVAVYAHDRLRNPPGLPAGYARLRAHLTLTVVALHGVVLAVLLHGGGAA